MSDVQEPLFRFGVVADPQYADLAMTLNRYYQNSRGKLAAAVRWFNTHEDLQFVASLGDAIDRHWKSFDAIMPVYAELNAPVRFVFGNHDFYVGAERLPDVPARLGLARGYYDFGVAGYRFVVVDGTEISTFSTAPGSPNHELATATLATMRQRGEPNAEDWNGGISHAQYAWLEETLARAHAAGERVIVLGHYPVYPFTDHCLWDSARLVEVLTAAPAVIAYLNGHDHRGGYAQYRGKHFLNFKGMVETERDTAYARVDVYPDRLEIVGQGTEPSRTLAY